MKKYSNQPDSPNHLTEFAPLSSDLKQPAVSFSLSRLFKRSKDPLEQSLDSAASYTDGAINRKEDQDKENNECKSAASTASSDESCISSLKEGEVYTRSFSNVLRRISNILDRRLSTPSTYKDKDIKQYWMPDNNCKECYDCGDKFTTFRRRHHCRVCGQIFCSRCCNQEISGKIIGCPGDLRVCTYCCKVVLQYMKSIDIYADTSSDLRSFQADLRSKLSLLDNQSDSSTYEFSGRFATRRKNSVGFREQGFSRNVSTVDVANYPGNKEFVSSEPNSDERQSLTQDSSQLRDLWSQIQDPIHGIQFHNHRHRLTTYPACIVGSELVDWLISEDKACARDQAVAICQALVDSMYLEPVITPERVFRDEYALFRAGVVGLRQISISRITKDEPQDGQEPSWVKEIKQDAYTTGFDTDESEEFVGVPHGFTRLTSSGSLFFVTLDTEEHSAVLSRNMLAEMPDTSARSSAGSTSSRDIRLDRKSSEDNLALTTSSLVEGVRTSVNDEILKGAMEINCSQIIDARDETTSLTGWHSAQNLRQDNGERLAFERFNFAYNDHERALLSQLLSSQGLSQSWSEIILPLAHKVSETVKPDVRHSDDDMDIRQYVQIKKIAGGKRSDSSIVNGVVCSKNVAHKRMKSAIVNPSILLVSSPIVYQRQENKLLSLDPAVLQEHDYLKNIVAKVASFSPDIILVEKGVSRLAQEFILDLDVSLVLNVKRSVLERVSRMTQGEIVSSIDSQIARPHLGMCHNFRLANYQIPNGLYKTLMVFDGCAQHLGCTVLLRGAPAGELKKVKTIVQFMILVSFNWMLERSFLMDELAMPPSYAAEDLQVVSPGSSKSPAIDTAREEIDGTTVVLRAGLAGRTLATTDQKVDLRPSKVKPRCESRSIDDRSDPLHSYLHSADESIFDNRGTNLLVSPLTFSNQFRKALDDTILSVSHGIRYSLPYLESEAGRQCTLRCFFPKQPYWSDQFHKGPGHGQSPAAVSWVPGGCVGTSAVCGMAVACGHPFTDFKLSLPLGEPLVQSGIADYRAQSICSQQLPSNKKPTAGENMDVLSDGQSGLTACMVDALDPFRHQRLSVLFSSYSSASMNAPHFCVNPWIAPMDFYGFSDIPLGGFLERYCFSSTYACPSNNCDTPMMNHVRKFVHESGCIHILIHKKDQPIKQCPENIAMWSWCRKCKEGTNVIPMSVDTWSLSFAKYLELRFHNVAYTRRGASGGCTHSLHQDHFQYFGYQQFIAAFKYSPIVLREIVLPAVELKCTDHRHFTRGLVPVIEDIKGLAVKGHSIYSAILEKICTLGVEGIGPKLEEYDMQTQLQAEKNIFKEKIEEIQIRLTSPSVESRDSPMQPVARIRMCEIDDCVIDLKRHMAETVNNWNNRLLEIVQQRKKEEKATRPTLGTIKLIPAQVGQLTGAGSDGAANTGALKTTEIGESTYRQLESSPAWDFSLAAGGSTEGIPPTSAILSSTPKPDAGSPPVEDPLNIPIEDGTMVTFSKKEDEESEEDNASEFPVLGISECKDNWEGAEVGLSDVSSSGKLLEGDDKKSIDLRPAKPGRSTDDDHLDCSKTEKRSSATVKHMISQLLSSAASVTLPLPFPSTEHYLLPHCEKLSLVVYEDEPSSIIAYALSSADYELGMQELKLSLSGRAKDSENSSPILKRKFYRESSIGSSLNERHPGISDSNIEILQDCEEADRSKPNTRSVNPHVEVQFADGLAKFYCRVYFAEQFRKLRAITFPDGEEAYARSLSRCLDWQAKGGKSGCTFCKTLDDRFILKQMTRLEVQSFLNFAPQYIQHITTAFADQKPVALAKILGFYRIVYRNVQSNETSKMDLLVMENLFYGFKISQKFDLKGSVRNRMVNTNEKQGPDIVLLDENLIKMMCDRPTYIRPHSKTVLSHVIAYDTQFLSQHWVMDYSLLVGFDEEQRILVVGIIDYIRTFTWDKKLETLVKSTGILGGQGKLPTVVSPELYRSRFCESMDGYFLQVPDHWSGLGQGVDS